MSLAAITVQPGLSTGRREGGSHEVTRSGVTVLPLRQNPENCLRAAGLSLPGARPASAATAPQGCSFGKGVSGGDPARLHFQSGRGGHFLFGGVRPWFQGRRARVFVRRRPGPGDSHRLGPAGGGRRVQSPALEPGCSSGGERLPRRVEAWGHALDGEVGTYNQRAIRSRAQFCN